MDLLLVDLWILAKLSNFGVGLGVRRYMDGVPKVPRRSGNSMSLRAAKILLRT